MRLLPFKPATARLPLAALSLLALGWTIGVTRAQDKAAATEDAQAEFAKIRGAVFGTVDKPDVHPGVDDVNRLMAQYVKATRDPKLLEVVTLDALADQKQGKFGSIELQILQTMQNQRIIALLEQLAAKPGGATGHNADLPAAADNDGHRVGAITPGRHLVAYGGRSYPGGYPGGDVDQSTLPPPSVAGNNGIITAHGFTDGRLTARGDAWIELTADNGQIVRFIPTSIGGTTVQAGKPDAKTMQRVNGMVLGDRVRVTWHVDDQIRLDGLRLIK